MLAGEVGKLLRSRTVWVCMILCWVFICFGVYTNYKLMRFEGSFSGQAAQQLSQIGQMTCPDPTTHRYGPCSTEELAPIIAGLEKEHATVAGQLRVSRAVASPAGGLANAMGFLGSGVGVVVGIFLGASCMDLEFRGRGWRTLLCVQGNRIKIAAGKILGVTGATIFTVVAAAVLVIGEYSVLRIVAPLPPAPTAVFDSLGLPGIGAMIAAALLVTLGFALLAMAAVLILRSALGGLVLIGALIAADRIAAMVFPHLNRFTLINNVGLLTAHVKNSEPVRQGLYLELWPRPTSGIILNGWLAVILLAIVCAAALTVAVARQDVN